MRNKKNKKWLRREIAKRARFTINDVGAMMDALEEIMIETIRKKDKFNFTGLFSLSVTEIEAHKGWDAVRKQEQFIDKSFRIKMSPSRSLLNLVRDVKDKDYSEDDDEDDDELYDGE